MKKRNLLILFLFAAFNFSQAQEFSFGAKVGLNLANFTGDALTGLDTHTGFHIGALAEIPLSQKFSIQPEVVYSEKGSEFFSTEVSLGYLDIPILAKYHIIEGLSAELGPVPSILINAKEERSGESKDVKDGTKTFDFGIGIGASYRLPMGIFFSLRFTKGVMDINKEDSSENNNTVLKVQNNVFQASAGYYF